jgi:signal transduction histidine kinase
VTIAADPGRILHGPSEPDLNAITVSPARPTAMLPESHVDTRATFRVEDCGNGIPANQRNRMFDRVLQVDRSNTSLRVIC